MPSAMPVAAGPFARGDDGRGHTTDPIARAADVMSATARDVASSPAGMVTSTDGDRATAAAMNAV